MPRVALAGAFREVATCSRQPRSRQHDDGRPRRCHPTNGRQSSESSPVGPGCSCSRARWARARHKPRRGSCDCGSRLAAARGDGSGAVGLHSSLSTSSTGSPPPDVGGEGSRGKKADELLASLVSRRAEQTRSPGPLASTRYVRSAKIVRAAQIVADNRARGRKTLVWSSFLGNVRALAEALAHHTPGSRRSGRRGCDRGCNRLTEPIGLASPETPTLPGS